MVKSMLVMFSVLLVGFKVVLGRVDVIRYIGRIRFGKSSEALRASLSR